MAAPAGPLRGRTFFLDVPSGWAARELAEVIRHLGGVSRPRPHAAVRLGVLRGGAGRFPPVVVGGFMGVKGWGRHGALVTAWSVGKGRVGHWEQFVVGSSGGAVAWAVRGVAEDLGKHRLGVSPLCLGSHGTDPT